jgi:WD40 repeat protein/formylglycine-generating enzyme required for sulfatase activity
MAAQKRWEKQFFLGAGITAGVLIIGLAIYFLIRALDKEPTAPLPEPIAKDTNTKPVTQKPQRPPTPEEEERRFQAKRAAEAEAAYQALEAKFKALGEGEPAGVSPRSFEAFAKDVTAFKAKHGGTPAAIKAAARLMELPSPLDGLNPKKLPADCLAAWRAEGREPPGELVGVLGEHRGRSWGKVRGLAWSSDGRLLASSSDDDTICIWESESRQLRSVIRGKLTSLGALAFASDSRRLFAAGSDGVHLFELATGEEILCLVHPHIVYSIAPSSDGSTVLTGCHDNAMRLWDVEQNKEVHRFKGHMAQVSHVAFSPDGTRALSASPDLTVRLWDVRNGEELHRLEGQFGVFADHGRQVLTSADKTPWRAWDAATGAKLRQYAFHYGRPMPDGKRIFLRNDTHGILWDLGTDKETKRFAVDAAQTISIAHSPDSRQVALGGTDGTVRLWDVETGKELQPLTGHVGPLHGVAFLPGCDGLVSRGLGDVRVWNLPGRDDWKIVEDIAPNATGCSPLSGDGDRMLLSLKDGIIGLFELDKQKKTTKRIAGYPGNAWLDGAIFSPDGKFAFTSSVAMELALWNLETGKLHRQLAGPQSRAHALAFSRDGRHALSGAEDGSIRLWEVATGRQLHVLQKQTQAIRSIDFTPDGRRFLVVDAGTGGLCWDLAKSDADALILPVSYPTFGACSPTGQHFATSSATGQVALWDATSGAKLHDWQLPGPVHAVAFAADGRHLATANSNGTVYIFRIPPVANAPGSPIKALSAAEAKQQQADEAKRVGGTVTIENSIGMKLNLIPAGKFLMGSPDDEVGHRLEEGPQHEVTITRSFYLGIYEVTQGQFEKVMGRNPAGFNAASGGGPEFPVENLGWADANEFCRKLSERPEEIAKGRRYRLPTEAEWEYACRAGSTSVWFFGNNAERLGEFAWFEKSSGPQTHRVGLLQPNAWGLYDLYGNVWEWCADSFDDAYYKFSPPSDPNCQASETRRVLRGGSWFNPLRLCRSAHRHSNAPTYKSDKAGFRVVCEIQGSADKPPK